jgi:hypothetical protein
MYLSWPLMLVLMILWWCQGFFSWSCFLPEGTGISGYREISEILPIYRTNFFNQILNSNFFCTKTNKVCIHFITYCWLSGVVSKSRSQSTGRGVEIWEMHRSNFAPFFTKHDLKYSKKINMLWWSRTRDQRDSDTTHSHHTKLLLL